MNIKELRIGNYIESIHGNADTYTIVDLSLFSTVEEGRLSEENIEPAPLTEEWLKRAGFIWSIYHQANHTEGFPYEIEQVSSDLYLMRSFRKTESFTVPLKYVHQLQNLVFALTGTELEFTE